MLHSTFLIRTIISIMLVAGFISCEKGGGSGSDSNSINDPAIPINDPVIFEYRIRELNGVKTISITGFSENWDPDLHAHIEIPEQIEGLTVTSIQTEAFKECAGLKSVIIPDCVISLQPHAFQDCHDLESVVIGDGVGVIGFQAFYSCYSLKSVIMGESVTSIAMQAFASCISLESITIPNTVTRIGYKAFRHCLNLTSIVIPDSVEFIDNIAFDGCARITAIKIGKSLQVSRPDKAVPPTVDDFESNGLPIAFTRCSRIASIEIDPDNKDYSSENDVLFSKDKTVLLKYSMKKTDTQYTIPDTVETIIGDAFNYSENLLSITIPDSVVDIGKWAFLSCRNLKSISIPDSVTSIGDLAFMNCESVTSVDIGKSFEPELNELMRIFTNCDAITEIKVSIDNPTYYSSIDGVLFSKDQKQIILYPPANSRTDYTIPDGVENIYSAAFSECNNLTSLTIGKDVNSIPLFVGHYVSRNLQAMNVAVDNQTFSSSNGTIFSKDGTKLIRLVIFTAGNGHYTIPDTVTTIDDNAFSYIENLNSITIPDSVTSLGSSTFYRCVNLDSITIPDSVASIGSRAFESCENLTSVTLPDSITEISSFIFYRCENLEAITIPDSVTIIDNTAFASCANLKSIIIPALVTEIGFAAFYRCENLDSIILNAVNPPTLENITTFQNNASGRKIYVPAGSVDDYKNAAYWSDYADDILPIQ